MSTPRTTPAGRILFVGAGPGNPDLLTLRAREVLVGTSVAYVDPDVMPGVRELVAADLPVPEEALREAEEAYERLCADAKASGSRRKPPRPAPPTAADIREPAGDPTEMSRALVAEARRGHDVVRLVAGNPLTSDDVLAEINAVSRNNIEFQIVPGMSVPSTVPAFAGIALGSTYTETDLGRADVDWDELASAPQPLVLQAVEDDLSAIAGELSARGLPDSLPTSVTVHGTTRLQRTYDVTLGTLAQLSGDLSGPLVVTLGKGVDNRSKYSWWENRALYGWNVLVPRAKGQAGPMRTRLAAHGAIPIEVPTISIEPPRSPAQMERAVKGLVDGRYQWVVFTSVNAVTAVWDKFTEFGLDARSFAGVRIAAVGHKTAAAIRELGITPELLPDEARQNAAGVVEVFPEFIEGMDPVNRVLLPRADIGTDVLVDGLMDLGWEVDDVTAYRTVRAAPPAVEIRDAIKQGAFDAVIFTSSSTVRNLVGIAGKPHPTTVVACIGPATARTAEENGLTVSVIAEEASSDSLVDGLAAYGRQMRAAALEAGEDVRRPSDRRPVRSRKAR